MSISVSVIICTHNRGHYLQRTLDALMEQSISGETFEVIVVDDGSQDETAEKCLKMQSQMPNLRVISNDRNRGLAKARNSGIEAASGNALLFTDDDCIPHQDWVERLSSALDEESIVAGTVASPSANYYTLCHNISQFHPFMPGRKARHVEFIAGANMAFRRSVFEDLKGFKNLGCAEDMEFILRARTKGYRLFYADDAVVVHDPARTTLSDIVKYASEHAAATILIRHQYRTLLKTPVVMRSPFLILTAAPIIALKVTAGIYARNLQLAKQFWTAPVVYGLKLAWCWGAASGLRHWHKREKARWANK